MKKSCGFLLGAFLLTVFAQCKDEVKPLDDIAYVHIQTSRAAGTSRGLVGGDMAPNLVVRLCGTGREILAFSGAYGSMVVPVHAGKYCGQLFLEDGTPITLNAKEKNCFTANKGERIEVDLTAAYDPNVKVLPSPPKLK